MIRSIVVSGIVAAVLSACGGHSAEKPSSDQKPVEAVSSLPETAHLKIYNWSDYVDPEIVADFGKKYGVTVKYDYYDSDETLEAKVLTGKSGYDLTGPSNAFIGRQIKAGAYQKLDLSLIPNYRHISPKLLELMSQVDPGNEYAVPFFWGTNTFAINVNRVKKALGTEQLPDNLWDLVFNPEYTAQLKQCGISYLDSAAEMYPMVLHYLGRNPNSSDRADIDAATELLKKNRPNIKRFTSSGFINDLARGDTCITVGFGGDLNIAKRNARDAGNQEVIEVMMPKEGVGIWVDSFAIPKDAANVLNAHRYINYILEPEVAAKNGNFVTYAPSSQPARELMEEEYRNDNSIFPSDDDLAHSFIMVPIEPESLKYMVRQWQGVKAGK